MTAVARAAEPVDGLEQALALTAELRACVEAGDFEAAADLEAARRALLEDFFAVRPPAADLERCVGLLRELVAANDVLVGLADHLQRALAREVETLGTGRRAVRAYGAAGP
ncbi:MAG: flagellar protein FliT [Steroidobacteraceae bacterium]|jgi:hypothetical protein|nr:flagellar protein FliT [Steroidobacteraceae bacterium]